MTQALNRCQLLLLLLNYCCINILRDWFPKPLVSCLNHRALKSFSYRSLQGCWNPMEKASEPQMGNLEATDRLLICIGDNSIENMKRENLIHSLLCGHWPLFSILQDRRIVLSTVVTTGDGKRGIEKNKEGPGLPLSSPMSQPVMVEHHSDGKESACNVGDPGSVSGLGRSLGGGQGNSSSTLAWRVPMDRGAWQAAVHGSQRVRHDEATKHSTPYVLGPLPEASAWSPFSGSL